MNNFINFVLLSLTVLVALGFATTPNLVEARYEARLVDGARHLDVDGTLIEYYIFAEERAVISPTPQFVIWDTETKAIAPLSAPLLLGASPNPENLTYLEDKNRTRTRSRSVSQTIGEYTFSRLSWAIRSKPFGALGIQGPRSWTSTGHPLHRFLLTEWTFQTAGEYNIDFNCTFFDGTHFKFNRTINVNRQPAFLANGPLPFGNNGSAWSPAPQASVQNILGVTIATSSVNVTFEFQAFPTGATWSGTFSKFTSSDGVVRFDDIVVSIPGPYTYRMVALLSDGSTLAANSVQITVERALPVVINRLSSFDGIARFNFFELPKFTMADDIGLAYNSLLNLSLRLASNNPLFSYEGFESVAQFSGTTSVKQHLLGYTFTFPDVSIDLPGPFEIAAEIALPDGSTLRSVFIANIDEAPTFIFPAGRTNLERNKISTMTIYGKRPPFDSILLMLGDDDNCTNQASDMIVWSVETSANLTAAGANAARNFSVVPWIGGTLYPCMKIPSQDRFGVLVERYLPQFDEQYPLVTSVVAQDVSECPIMSELEALTYRSGGWDTADAGRQYGCALPNPSSGTIPPCNCPSHLTCNELSHSSFTPSNLNIGTCQCCAAWIMTIAAIVIFVVFAGMCFVVYEYV